MTRTAPLLAAFLAAIGSAALAQSVALERIASPAAAAMPEISRALTGVRPPAQPAFLVPAPPEAVAPRAEALQGRANFVRIVDLDPSDPNVALATKVGQVVLFDGEEMAGVCSGFLVGPELFMTNYHCAVDMETGEPRAPSEILVLMEHLRDGDLGPRESRALATTVLKTDRLLDYALLRLSSPLGERYGWLALETEEAALRRTTDVKIIQHPAGRPKEIVTEDTQLTDLRELVMHYLADTEGGSSGSPVFDLRGERVIGLHHAGAANNYNEGLNMPRIAAEIALYLPEAASPAAAASALDALTAAPPPVSATERSEPATLDLPAAASASEPQAPENFGVGAGSNRGDGSATTIELNWD